MEEFKSIFSRFIERNRDKKPYIFALIVREWMSSNYFECYHLDANGNTAVDFESQGMGSLAELNSRLKEWVAKREADGIPLDKETKRLRKSFGIAPDILDYKYSVEEWLKKTFTDNGFPKSDSMILAYITENEQNITDEEKYTMPSSRSTAMMPALRGLEKSDSAVFFTVPWLAKARTSARPPPRLPVCKIRSS